LRPACSVRLLLHGGDHPVTTRNDGSHTERSQALRAGVAVRVLWRRRPDRAGSEAPLDLRRASNRSGSHRVGGFDLRGPLIDRLGPTRPADRESAGDTALPPHVPLTHL